MTFTYFSTLKKCLQPASSETDKQKIWANFHKPKCLDFRLLTINKWGPDNNSIVFGAQWFDCPCIRMISEPFGCSTWRYCGTYLIVPICCVESDMRGLLLWYFIFAICHQRQYKEHQRMERVKQWKNANLLLTLVFYSIHSLPAIRSIPRSDEVG